MYNITKNNYQENNNHILATQTITYDWVIVCIRNLDVLLQVPFYLLSLYSSRQCEELVFAAPYQSHLHLFWTSKRKINDPASAHTFLSWTYSFQSLITLDLVRHNPSCNKNLEPANTRRSWQFCFTILQNAQNSPSHNFWSPDLMCLFYLLISTRNPCCQKIQMTQATQQTHIFFRPKIN
jgi:hypothetical protein